MSSKGSRGPWLWPLALVIVGIALLLDNFLLLGNFKVVTLLPLLLVVIGAQILLRGDIAPSTEARTFGITRGSVESATLEINAGEIDVQIRALQREGRLIAGQYAVSARPAMRVSDTHTHLKMDRASTSWLSFADWEMGLARDLPWQILVSSHLGQVNLDLGDLIVRNIVVGTGIGDIRLICPQEAFEPLHLRSTLGNIHLITPVGIQTRISVDASYLFKVHADERRYHQPEPGVYVAHDADEGATPIEITISGTFGDAFLT